MKNGYFRKGFIFAIIFLFLGTAVTPSIGRGSSLNNIAIKENNTQKKLFLADTYNPTDDAYLKEDHPNDNLGNLQYMNIRNEYGGGGSSGWSWQGIVKFDISNIPSGSTINYAHLKLYYYYYEGWDPVGRAISLHRALANWNENTITWNNQPPCESQTSAYSSVPSSYGWMTWDVTNDVQDFINGQKTNYGWKITDDSYWGDYDIPTTSLYCKEHGTNIPYLEIDIQQQNNPPNPPSAPNPPDGATGVSIYTMLSWTCSDPDGDPLTYNVYFGTSSNPPLVSQDQSQNYYDPGILNYNTHYYWKIVAVDIHGASTTGPIWSFTTGSQPPPDNPPYTPSNPTPENGSTNVNLNVILSWSGGDPDPGDTVVYDVYLEANNPNPTVKVSNNQDGTSFNPGTLEPSTIYYWKIYAIDNHNVVTKGPIWHFTTKQIQMNNPPNTPNINGPTRFKPNENIEFNFLTTDPDGDQIFYYIDWGDNTNTSWIGPYASGNQLKLSHTWTEQGTFIIKCKAKDIYNLESNFGSLVISIPRIKILTSNFLMLLENHLNLFPILQKLLNRLRQ